MSSTSDSVLESLSEDVRSFYALREIKRMHEPSAAEFLRHAVSCHQPVIITGLLDDWKAMEKWETTEGFLNSCPEQVNVNLTPDGRADSIQAQADGEDGEDYFVTPAETSLNSRLFMDMLENPIEGDAVAYLSQQNDNLRATMPTLLDDCAPSLPLADSVFLGDALLADKPEAINLWVGTEKSVSSTHKDYFENMYAVVRGEKTFTLFPPTDIIFLPNKKCKSRAYKYNGPNTHTSLSRPSQADLQVSLDGYISVLLVSCFMRSGALDSSGVLQSHPVISLASDITIMLISTLF